MGPSPITSRSKRGFYPPRLQLSSQIPQWVRDRAGNDANYRGRNRVFTEAAPSTKPLAAAFAPLSLSFSLLFLGAAIHKKKKKKEKKGGIKNKFPSMVCKWRFSRGGRGERGRAGGWWWRGGWRRCNGLCWSQCRRRKPWRGGCSFVRGPRGGDEPWGRGRKRPHPHRRGSPGAVARLIVPGSWRALGQKKKVKKKNNF